MLPNMQENIEHNITGYNIPNAIIRMPMPQQFVAPVFSFPLLSPPPPPPNITFHSQTIHQYQTFVNQPSPVKDFPKKLSLKYVGPSNQNLNLNSPQSNDSDNEGILAKDMDSVFYELHCLSLEGCQFAENIASLYRKRPCFKKIEMLLSALRQQLNINQNIVSNINSQGTAWAIKDFIFVFSRLVNSWVILRGYIYDDSKALESLRKNFDTDFIDCFTEWQQSTLKMMKSLMRSVENLNFDSQIKSGNAKAKKEAFTWENDLKDYDHEFLKAFKKNLFTPKCPENSDEIQIRNHQNRKYFRPGVLKPLLISSTSSPRSSVTSPTTPENSHHFWSNEDLFLTGTDSPFSYPSGSSSERLYNRGKSLSAPTTPLEPIANLFDSNELSRAKKDLSGQFNSINLGNDSGEGSFHGIDINLDSNDDLIEKLKALYADDAMKINYLINEISKLPQVNHFAINVNMIVEGIKIGKYGRMKNILDELKTFLAQTRTRMKNCDGKDKNDLKMFINQLDSILKRKAFQ